MSPSDDLFDDLRADLVPADLSGPRLTSIQSLAHAELAARAPSARRIGRALEPFAVGAIALAQIMWAWSVVLR